MKAKQIKNAITQNKDVIFEVIDPTVNFITHVSESGTPGTWLYRKSRTPSCTWFEHKDLRIESRSIISISGEKI